MKFYIAVVTYKCKHCYQQFLGFYALRQHKNTQNGFPIKSASVDPEAVINEMDLNLEEELHSYQHFLMGSELEIVRYKVFNYAVEKHNKTVVSQKLDLSSIFLKCATKVDLAYGLNLKNIEDGKFRYLYAHESITPLDWSRLVCTKDDLTNSKSILNETDVIELCLGDGRNSKWRCYKLTKLTVFALYSK